MLPGVPWGIPRDARDILIVPKVAKKVPEETLGIPGGCPRDKGFLVFLRVPWGCQKVARGFPRMPRFCKRVPEGDLGMKGVP